MENELVNQNDYSRINYFNKMIDLRKVLVGYGRWLEQRNISGQGSIQNYEEYLIEGQLIENENVINGFVERLKNDEYKCILYNNQTPILKYDLGLINLVIGDLNEDSEVELINDELIIHNENEIITLTGYEEMSEGEIFARQYLDECGDILIIKDSEMQIDMREDNFHDIVDENYYSKCKNIINIRDFSGYDEESLIYKMNWDTIIVQYKDENSEIWQRG